MEVARAVALVLLSLLFVGVIIGSLVSAIIEHAQLAQSIAATLSPRPSPIVLLISIDGFRNEYLSRNITPAFTTFAETGVRAKFMRPVFPTKTFPNHYSIVTGLYPESHGIVSNSFYDPVFNATFQYSRPQDASDARWWGGEPIWNTVIKANKTAACCFWPGSEAPIQGIRPTYYFDYAQAATLDNLARVIQVMNWLKDEQRPSFISMYISNVDSVGHTYGTTGTEITRAIMDADNVLAVVRDSLIAANLFDKVDVIVVSDHGMADVSAERCIYIDDYISLSDVVVYEYGPVTAINPVAGKLDEIYQALKQASESQGHFNVFKRDGNSSQTLPARVHYNNNRRIMPIMIVMDEGWSISRRSLYSQNQKSFLKGNHGWDNIYESMNSIFVAHGPHFKKGVTVDGFESIEIYNLIAWILKLQPAPNNGTWPSALITQAVQL